MEITKEVLEAKLAGYEGAAKQAEASMIANRGAAEAIRRLIELLEKEKVPADTTPDKKGE